MAIVYGSMATGFAYEASDMDIALSGIKATSKKELEECIEKLSHELKTSKFVLDCQALPMARVPLIKLVIASPKPVAM